MGTEEIIEAPQRSPVRKRPGGNPIRAGPSDGHPHAGTSPGVGRADPGAPSLALPTLFLVLARESRVGCDKHGLTLLEGGVEMNPGPWINEDFQLDPPLFEWAVRELNSPTPRVDVFASRSNTLLCQWWSKQDCALTHPWGGPVPVWANPPFSLLARVEEKILREGANILLLCPEWGGCAGV